MIDKITYLMLGLAIGFSLSVALAGGITDAPGSLHRGAQLQCHDQDANNKLDRILIGLDIQP